MPTDWWTNNPHLTREWGRQNDVQPQEVSRGSDQRPWWRCGAGHEWQATVLTRVKGSGCPFCSGRRATGSTSLATRRPDLLDEWNVEMNANTPTEVTWRSSKSAWWRCVFGHQWEMPIANRTIHGQGCPYCAGKRAAPESSLLALFPLVAQEWHPRNPIGPEKVRPKSHKKYLWSCSKGHTYQTSVASRTHLGTGCPVCAWQTSKLELRVYCELKALLPGVQWHDRSFGFEIDVFLSKHRVGIEVDGWYWHKDSQLRDRRKSDAMEAAGVRPIRLRGAPLPLIGPDDFSFPKNHDPHLVVYRIVRVLREICASDIRYDPSVWLNEPEYQRMLAGHGE